MNKKSLLLALPVLLLASCGNGNPDGLPATNQELVDYVAGRSGLAILDNGQHLRYGDEGNHLPSGSVVNLVPSVNAKIWDGAAAQTIAVPIEWTVDKEDSWTIDEQDDVVVCTPETPLYGEPDLESTFTGAITWGDASASITVKVTIQAIQEPPVEYTSIGELWNDFFVDKTITTGTYVTVTGYVTGVNKSRQNVYIQTDEYAVQLYKADAYSALFTEGNLITATGSITNYYGLELEDISSVVASDAEGIPEAVATPLTKEIIDSVTANGTKWDNSMVKATATLVEDQTSEDSDEGTYLMRLEDGGEFYLFTKHTIDEAWKAEYDALLQDPANIGKSFEVQGLVSFYSKTSMFEVIPFNDNWVALAE